MIKTKEYEQLGHGVCFHSSAGKPPFMDCVYDAGSWIDYSPHHHPASRETYITTFKNFFHPSVAALSSEVAFGFDKLHSPLLRNIRELEIALWLWKVCLYFALSAGLSDGTLYYQVLTRYVKTSLFSTILTSAERPWLDKSIAHKSARNICFLVELWERRYSYPLKVSSLCRKSISWLFDAF